MKRAISTYVRPRVAEFVDGLARNMEVSVSSCVAMLLEQAMRSHMAIGLARKASSVGSVPVQDADDQTVPTYAREDIECDLRECSDPANLITFFSKEEFLNDFDGLMEQVLAEKELSQRFGKTCARK